MKITIITVTYNSGQFLEHCIQSVLKQDYPHIEYIIIDGKSTDNTIDIIKKHDKYISKWQSEPDSGIYDAMNKGIKLATGDIIGILNSDDLFMDKSVLTRVAKAFKDSDKEIIFSDVSFFSDNNPEKITRHYSSKLFKSWMFRFGFQPAHPTFYTKKVNFEKYGYYRTDLSIAGDFELLMRFLTLHKLPYKYISDTWVNMRLGGASTSGLKSILKLNAEILQACKTNTIYSNYVMVYSKYFFKWWGFIFRSK